MALMKINFQLIALEEKRTNKIYYLSIRYSWIAFTALSVPIAEITVNSKLKSGLAFLFSGDLSPIYSQSPFPDMP